MREYNELPTAKSKNIGQIALEVVNSIWGYLCRQGLKGILEDMVTPGAKGDFGGYGDARGQMGIFGEINPEGVACLYEKGRLSF